jgi:hypothetical protein
MLLRLGLAAMQGSRGDNPAARKAANRKQPGQRGGPITLLLIVGFGAYFVIAGLAHVSMLLFVLAPVIIAVSLLGGIALKAVTSVRSVPRPPKDSLVREQRVKLLMAASCPTCGAVPRMTCKIDGNPYAILDAKWDTRCHFDRIERSVQLGFSRRADVIAQFGGQLPEGLHL